MNRRARIALISATATVEVLTILCLAGASLREVARLEAEHAALDAEIARASARVAERARLEAELEAAWRAHDSFARVLPDPRLATRQELLKLVQETSVREDARLDFKHSCW